MHKLNCNGNDDDVNDDNDMMMMLIMKSYEVIIRFVCLEEWK